MSIKDTGGPAFPLQTWDPVIHTPKNEVGMTLRDYFAAKAMQASLNGDQSGNIMPEHHASWAFEMADAMLKARTA